MSTDVFHFEDTYQRAITLFHDQPNAAQEQALRDAFQDGPRHTNDLIERIGTDVTTGKINSGWAVLTKRLTITGPRNLIVTDTQDRSRAIANAKAWMHNAGMHFDRESEVIDELFEKGMLRQWKNDESLRQEILHLWLEKRPVGEQIEQEAEERMRAHKEHRAKVLAALAHQTEDKSPQPKNLERASDGECNDCQKPRRRWHYGAFFVCSTCAVTRQKVQQRDARELHPGDLRLGLPIRQALHG